MNAEGNAESLHVAAVQMASSAGAVKENLRKAQGLVAKAVDAGAELVLLPELMGSGYRIAPDIWDTAEPVGGRVSTWLCETAQRHKIHIGTTILEADGEDFYNTFLLATPAGDLAGMVRKSDPAWVEARYYRGQHGSHVIETAIGRIGVGICYENYLGDHIRTLSNSSIDLLLQPTAAAIPPTTWPVGLRGARAFNTMLDTLAERWARILGVPVVMANMCGHLSSPLPGSLRSLKTEFAGLSSIVDGSGDVLAKLASEEGVINGRVIMGSRSVRSAPLPEGRWSVPMPWYAIAWPMIQRICARGYEHDGARKASAYRLSRR